MTSKTKLKIKVFAAKLLILSGLSQVFGYNIQGPFPTEFNLAQTTALDTFPIKDRKDDFINDKQYNPFDILPTEIDQKVEYDEETDSYIIYEKIGDEYYRSPSYMTFNEYLDWRAKEQETRYFERLAGYESAYKSAKGRLDPMSKVNIEKNLINRLFGGEDITIEPQGSIDLSFGARYVDNDNPRIDQSQQTQLFIPDFDMDIKMNVEGKIGDKMDLDFNYDTNASFDFDRKIKLVYDSEQWTEDDILKKIEAGNVSFPLRSSLIQGAQELFGLKTELQFGNLTLTGVVSQQRSKAQSLTVQNGATEQEFRIRPEDYDENRHFFISHYHRDAYEEALSNLPYINTNFRITNIEVWISDDRPNFQSDQTMIVALSDIAESDPSKFSNKGAAIGIDNDMEIVRKTTDDKGRRLPDNTVNGLYDQVNSNDRAKRIQFTKTELVNMGLKQNRDFETFRGRKLSNGEYFFNSELGFISLNVRLRPNQVLSVSYEYFYTNNCEDVYKVGGTTDETSVSNTNRNGAVQSEGVIITKLLKGTTQRVDQPTWDLMMKNVYPLRTNQLDQSEFQFDVFYEDDADGTLKKFIPVRGFELTPLLNIFGLDQLNSRNDPQPDGVFDFVPGITVVPQSGSIVFPVLEPFGDALENSMNEILTDVGTPQEEIDSLIDFYTFHELYDTSVTAASLDLAQNKFIMAGKIKSESNSEFSLGAWNIPEGSVRVRAGSQELIEGVHYEVDYGIGRVRIIDQAIIQQGVPVNISFEDNSVFSLQQRSMMGLRADYEVNENLFIGGTFLRLAERPFTQKVNIGDDPIKNRVFGIDMDYNKEAPWLTKLVDKLPIYSTNARSNINFTAEAAALVPGHQNVINEPDVEDGGGLVSIDDFEGAVNGFPLSSQPIRWVLASIPNYENDFSQFPESKEFDSRLSGVNRARLSWYVIDRFVNISEATKNANPYTRRINQTELFQRQIPQGQLPDLLTFDMTYYPEERGPYNFDLPNGTEYSAGLSQDDQTQELKLNEPETRWGGIMRYLNNNDFEATNYEFIEFWLLNPFMDKPDGSGHVVDEEGFLTFHLGNVSEDILNDNVPMFENALPRNDSIEIPRIETNWGSIPAIAPVNDAFPGVDFQNLDLGLDGLDNNEERAFFGDWFNEVSAQFPLPVSVREDVAADDFTFFNDENVFDAGDQDLLQRYKFNNNPQGNSPDVSNSTTFQRGNPQPDKEDMNNNKALDTGESFHEYKVKLANSGGEIDRNATPYIRDVRELTNGEKWYRFRIPLNESRKVNGIEGFRSIQFLRILVNGFQTQKTFRLAEFELIRNQWRRIVKDCVSQGDTLATQFSVDVVGVEENSSKKPFGYKIPRGIQQEQIFTNFSAVNQDENSIVLDVQQLPIDCEASILKLTELDLRVFEKMQMFVHAEQKPDDPSLKDGDAYAFIRIGKDFERHYYEYAIPLTLSDSTWDRTLEDIVWPAENKFNFPLEVFIQAKKIRNVSGHPLTEPFSITRDSVLSNLSQFETIDTELMDTLPENHRVSIVGNPNLGQVKGISVGVINESESGFNKKVEVWFNELRVTGFQERGGVAALARLDMQLADLGSLTSSASYSSLGWGQLADKVNERAKEEIIEYDIATNLELGKFFPQHWNLRVPFYAQYANSITNPEFDAYDLDITVEDEFDLFQDVPDGQEIVKQRNQIVNTIKTINLTNVRKERGGGRSQPGAQTNLPGGRTKTAGAGAANQGAAKKPKKPMPWNIENFSASYSYTENKYRDPILKADNSKEQSLGLDYNFSRKGGYIQPFKKIKSKNLRILKEFNFNLLPNSFSFNSTINRFVGVREFRIPVNPVFQFDDRRFNWTRRYDLNWNLTKALKLNFSASNESYIDEARQVGIAETPEEREWVAFVDNGSGFLTKDTVTAFVNSDPNYVTNLWKDNLKRGGRNTNYGHNLNVSYTVPVKYLPYMDWIDVKANYKADYNWSAGALVTDAGGFPLAGIIQNSQSRSINFNFSFDKLYNKSRYLKSLDQIGKSRVRSRVDDQKDKVTVSKDKNGNRVKRKTARLPGSLEKLVLRPLLLLRSVRINYKEDFSTVVPGFTGTPEYLGLDDGFSNPGTGFVFGLQPNIDPDDPNNFLTRAADNGWITPSQGLNQELVQMSNQSFDAKIKIEPWKDFKVDVDFKKNYRSTHSEVFKNVDKDGVEDFQALAARDMGSFDITYFNMQTLFGRSIDGLFNRFQNYRPVISNRLPNNSTERHTEDGIQYTRGYGKQSSAVLVPAFLAAYTDKDPNFIDLDLEEQIRNRKFIPKPNWNLRYNGLTKLPWFRDKFSDFTIEHAYSSQMRVSNFNSDVQFDRQSPFASLRENGNYYTRVEIPAIQVTENFNPVIGFKMKTKTDFTMEFEYLKSRDLNLKINTSSQLEEDRKTGFVFGLGYTIKDSNFLKKKKRKGRKSRNAEENDDDPKTDNNGRRNALRTNTISSTRGSDMTFLLNFEFSDNAFYVHELDRNVPQEENETRGSKGFQLSPSVDYNLNDNVSLRAFFDYNTNTPYGSESYKRTTIAGGITMRLNLN